MRSFSHQQIIAIRFLVVMVVSLVLPLGSPLSADGLTLLAFKSAVSDDPSSALGDWSETDADPCHWSGVSCANLSGAGGQAVVGLAVAGKNLSGYIPSELGSLLFLRRLNLHNNRLTGAVPSSLSNASSLHSIFLYNNGLSGGFPAFLCDLPRLQNLDLSGNMFNGSLPDELRNCQQLQRLLLSENQFSGGLPAGVWPNLPSLTQLDLSSNSFNGSIPPDIGELSSLSSALNLSHNHFTGDIPAELGHLPATVSLDLRFNNLSGEIPQNGSLADQSTTAFLNNPNLCGFPLLIPCPSSFAPDTAAPPPAPATTAAGSLGAGKRRLSTTLIVVISAADAAGVALVGIVVVYVYWKVKDGKENRKSGLTAGGGSGGRCCWCKPANGSSDESSGDDQYADMEGGEEWKGSGGGSSGGAGRGGGETRLVAIDRGFEVELEELLRSSAYVLGKGWKGIVYKVVVGGGARAVAVRRLGAGGAGGEQRWREFAAEAAAVGKARHANVVRLRAYYWSPEEKLIVTDYIANGNLAAALRGRSGHRSLSWSIRLRIAKGVARGMAYIHDFSARKFVHSELKPSNILLDTEYNAHIADFGLGRLISLAGCNDSVSSTGAIGNAFPAKPGTTALPERRNPYRAPEAAAPGARPSQKWDVYSFGVVLLELLTGRLPEQTSPSTSSSSSSLAPLPLPPGEGLPELVRWVRQGFEDGRALSDMVDPVIHREVHAKKEVIAAFHLALACAEPDPEKRPRMKAASERLDKIMA